MKDKTQDFLKDNHQRFLMDTRDNSQKLVLNFFMVPLMTKQILKSLRMGPCDSIRCHKKHTEGNLIQRVPQDRDEGVSHICYFKRTLKATSRLIIRDSPQQVPDHGGKALFNNRH